jgi:hypothetical protein
LNRLHGEIADNGCFWQRDMKGGQSALRNCQILSAFVQIMSI